MNSIFFLVLLVLVMTWACTNSFRFTGLRSLQQRRRGGGGRREEVHLNAKKKTKSSSSTTTTTTIKNENKVSPIIEKKHLSEINPSPSITTNPIDAAAPKLTSTTEKDKENIPKVEISNAIIEKMQEDKMKNPSLDIIAMQKALSEYAESTSAEQQLTKRKKGFGSSDTNQPKITKEQWFEEYEKLKAEQDLSPAGSKKKEGEYAFGEKVLERFQPGTLKLIDSMLVGATFISLSVVIAIGVALSLSSLKIPNTDFQLDPALINVINNSLYPAFTPAIGVLFLCSITFGIFKYAQVSSSKTVYTED